MKIIVSATQFIRRFGYYLSLAEHHVIEITKYGKVACCLVPITSEIRKPNK